MKEKIRRFIQAFRMNGAVKKRTLTIAIPALAILLLLIVLLCLLPKHEKEEEPVADDPVIDEPVIEAEPVVLPEAYTEELMTKYPDIYGYLEIPGTSAVLGTPADVSYPLLQNAANVDFYLDHDLDGNSSKAGCLYSQSSWNRTDLSDPVHIIYGHNMANRTMFGGLQSYMSQLQYSGEDVAYIYQPERRLTYRLFAGVQYDTSHILYYNDFSVDGVLTQFIDNLCHDTDSYTNINKEDLPVEGDRLLILSVCKNGDNNHRYLIIGKLIEDTDVTHLDEMTPAAREYAEAKLAQTDTAAAPAVKTDGRQAG